MKVFSVLETILRLTFPPFSLSAAGPRHMVRGRGGVIVVASILGPWRLLPSNAPRGALNVRTVWKGTLISTEDDDME
jgi:hypothetical protein